MSCADVSICTTKASPSSFDSTFNAVGTSVACEPNTIIAGDIDTTILLFSPMKRRMCVLRRNNRYSGCANCSWLTLPDSHLMSPISLRLSSIFTGFSYKRLNQKHLFGTFGKLVCGKVSDLVLHYEDHKYRQSLQRIAV